ncbi:MAG: phosphate propanoyltransferase [Oscillospiraceae bacterium]|nr:phosphate propanoyltransferase [Oscillospiraceae bacterium]
MTAAEIRRVVADTLKTEILPKDGSDTVGSPTKITSAAGEIPLEVSARHLHLSQEALDALFGAGSVLRCQKELSQPGEFLSDKRVTLATAQGKLTNVAVLGPVRQNVQAELSASDCRKLRLEAPIAISGDLSRAADIEIHSEKGTYHAKKAVIIAKNHIHATPADAEKLGLSSGQRVSVRTNTPRPVTFHDVAVRIDPNFTLAMHIDTDEANACCANGNRKEESGKLETAQADLAANQPNAQKSAETLSADNRQLPTDSCLLVDEKLVCETRAKELAGQCGGRIKIAKRTILTPSARDVFLHRGIEIIPVDSA